MRSAVGETHKGFPHVARPFILMPPTVPSSQHLVKSTTIPQFQVEAAQTLALASTQQMQSVYIRLHSASAPEKHVQEKHPGGTLRTWVALAERASLDLGYHKKTLSRAEPVFVLPPAKRLVRGSYKQHWLRSLVLT